MEFDYLKVGDKCWVWDSIRNVTEESKVTCRVDSKVDVENIGAFHLEDGRCSTIYDTPHLRLVHAPFKAEFPPKPKRKVKKEGWVSKYAIYNANPDTHGVGGYIPITYEVEE